MLMVFCFSFWVCSLVSYLLQSRSYMNRLSSQLTVLLYRPSFYDAARGLTGIGAGIMLPTAVALLGRTYPPGRNRNLAFGLFGKTPVYLYTDHWLNFAQVHWLRSALLEDLYSKSCSRSWLTLSGSGGYSELSGFFLCISLY